MLLLHLKFLLLGCGFEAVLGLLFLSCEFEAMLLFSFFWLFTNWSDRLDFLTSNTRRNEDSEKYMVMVVLISVSL